MDPSLTELNIALLNRCGSPRLVELASVSNRESGHGNVCRLGHVARGQGGVGARPNEWTEVDRFDTVTVAARRIRELEGYLVALEA